MCSVNYINPPYRRVIFQHRPALCTTDKLLLRAVATGVTLGSRQERRVYGDSKGLVLFRGLLYLELQGTVDNWLG